jgi:Fe-S cluster assembly scaffold protein SufB
MIVELPIQNFLLSESTSIEFTESGKYVVELIKPGVHVDIVGKFLAQQKDEINIELYIIHKAAHTSAKTILKGVARDQSSIRFFGRIKIEEKCPGIQSFLEERVLLLSDKAKAEAIPELEILSDDVKCSHAASVSRIPEEHLFYLQSRGIPPQQAEDLIVEGFLERGE